MSTLIRLLKLLKPYWRRMLLAALFGFLTVAGNMGLLGLSAFLIASAALHPPVLDLMPLVTGVRFFGLSRAVFRYLERYFSHDVTFKILSQLRVWFYAAIEPLAPACLLDYRSGELLSHIVADVETLQDFYLRVISPPLVALLTLAGVCIFLAYFAWFLAVIFLGFFLAAGVVLPLIIRGIGRGLSRRAGQVRVELNAQLVDNIQGLPDILAFGQADRRLTKLAELSRELMLVQGKEARLSGLAAAGHGLLMNLAMWTVLTAAISLLAGRPAVYLPALALVALSGFEAVQPLALVFHYLDGTRTAAERLFKISDAPPAVSDSRVARLKPDQYGLEIRNLSFRYEQDAPWVLQGLDLWVPQGGRVALVGPSGSGKSTLVNLLLRFWDYPCGSIRLGPHQINEMAQEDLRSLIGVVTQHTHLFNATVRENLLFAQPGAAETEMIQAARMADIDDFVQNLPQGYDTYIGEGGFKLSGGQRQRLAIARVLLKDAPILILDEATTGLDPVSERAVLDTIFRLMAGRTTLIITHRLVGLEQMDNILVLQAGQVVEQGTQQQLFRRRGLYYDMWRLQHQIISG